VRVKKCHFKSLASWNRKVPNQPGRYRFCAAYYPGNRIVGRRTSLTASKRLSPFLLKTEYAQFQIENLAAATQNYTCDDFTVNNQKDPQTVNTNEWVDTYASGDRGYFIVGGTGL